MFTVRIITPQGFYRQFQASILNLRTTNGQIGLLANHMPLVAILETSIMNLVDEQKDRREFAIGEGVVYFEDNIAQVLVETCESKDEIDFQRAQQAYERAQQRLSKEYEDVDFQRAEKALKKAKNRLSLQ